MWPLKGALDAVAFAWTAKRREQKGNRQQCWRVSVFLNMALEDMKVYL